MLNRKSDVSFMNIWLQNTVTTKNTTLQRSGRHRQQIDSQGKVMCFMNGNKCSRRKAKKLTRRIYVPFPIEVILKIISWTVVIAIDIVEFVMAPFMRIGIKCCCVFALLAAIFSGYVFFDFDLLLHETLLLYVLLLLLFLVCMCAIRLLKYILIKIIRPPFAEIVFESVAVSFRRPFVVKRNERRLLKRLCAEKKKDSADQKNYNPQQIDCIDE